MAAATEEGLRAKILDFLKKAGSPQKVQEVAKHFSILKAETNKHLYAMEKMKKVKNRGSGQWEVICESATGEDRQETTAPMNASTALVPVGCRELIAAPCSSVIATQDLTEYEEKVLSFLRAYGGRRRASALDIAKGIGMKTAKDVNPGLYSLREKGLLDLDEQSKQWLMKGAGDTSASGNTTVGTEARVGLIGKRPQIQGAPSGQLAQDQARPPGYQAPTRAAPALQQSPNPTALSWMQSHKQAELSGKQLYNQAALSWKQSGYQATKSLKQSQNQAELLAQHSQSQALPSWPLAQSKASSLGQQAQKQGAPAWLQAQTPVAQPVQQAQNPAGLSVKQEKNETAPSAQNEAVQLGHQAEYKAEGTGHQAQNQAASSGKQAQSPGTRSCFEAPVQARQSGQQAQNKAVPTMHQAQNQAAPPGKLTQDPADQSMYDVTSVEGEDNIKLPLESVNSEANVDRAPIRDAASASPDHEHATQTYPGPQLPSSTDDITMARLQHEHHVALCDIRDDLAKQTVAVESLRQIQENHTSLLKKRLAVSRRQARATKEVAVAVTSCAQQMQTLNRRLQQGNAMLTGGHACASQKPQSSLAQLTQLLAQYSTLVQSAESEPIDSVLTTPPLPSGLQSTPRSPQPGSEQGRGQRKLEQDLGAVEPKRKK